MTAIQDAEALLAMEARIKKLEGLLKGWLNEAPFRSDGLFYNHRAMAEQIVKEWEEGK